MVMEISSASLIFATKYWDRTFVNRFLHQAKQQKWYYKKKKQKKRGLADE